MAAAVAVGALALLAACGDEEAPVATGGELIRLDAAADRAADDRAADDGAAHRAPSPRPSPRRRSTRSRAASTGTASRSRPATRTVVEFWEDELDEDLVQLVAECERLAAEEPQRVQDMIAESKAIDEFLRQMAAQTTAPDHRRLTGSGGAGRRCR